MALYGNKRNIGLYNKEVIYYIMKWRNEDMMQMNKKTYTCVRCNYSWDPHHAFDTYKYGLKPQVCAYCKSPNWEVIQPSTSRRCFGACVRFLSQIPREVNTNYKGSYNRRVVKKLSGHRNKNSNIKTDANDYYYCQRCEIYMKKWLAFLNEISHRIECPCCGGAVRLDRRYSDVQNKEKYVY